MVLIAKRGQSRQADSPAPALTRLGIDQPAGWWPAAPRLKSYEAAGFAHLQVRLPTELLADEAMVSAHAGALAERLALTGLRLILHAPDDLVAGTTQDDARLDGALRYAAVAGAELLVLHGSGISRTATGLRARLAAERRSLRGRLGCAERMGVRLAFENLAPAYRGHDRVADDLAAVAALVESLDSDQVGICLDIGHGHIAAGRLGMALGELIEPVLERVLLFHVHDNFGDGGPPQDGWVEPLRLDLHLPPGAGTLPWASISPMIAGHGAPVLVEVHASARPEPGTLAVMTRELLGLGPAAPVAAPTQ